MTALTEARVREIVREELAAQQAELHHDRLPGGVIDSGTSFESLDPVLQGLDADGERRRELTDNLVEFLDGYITFVTTDGTQGLKQIQDAVSRRHRLRNVVREGPDSVSGFVGGGGSHDASPSLGLENQSVGEDRPGPAGEVGPGHAESGDA